MSDAETKYSAGEIALLTSGSYSDYYVQGAARVLRDCDFAELYPLFSKEYNVLYESTKHLPWPKREPKFVSARISSFISWLEREGYVEEITQRELNLDDMRSR